MVYLEIVLITALILANGALAMSELAVVSSRRARIHALVQQGVRGAGRALALASDPGRFLSTVQIGHGARMHSMPLCATAYSSDSPAAVVA